jgi:uncharacterized Tic20 family protein
MPTSDKVLVLLCHLSVFVGAPFLLPFIVWLLKRHEPDVVGAHAAEVLNFHLSYLLYTLCLVPLVFFWVGVPLVMLIAFAGLVLAVIGAVKASDGILYRYPLTIRLVK